MYNFCIKLLLQRQSDQVFMQCKEKLSANSDNKEYYIPDPRIYSTSQFYKTILAEKYKYYEAKSLSIFVSHI